MLNVGVRPPPEALEPRIARLVNETERFGYRSTQLTLRQGTPGQIRRDIEYFRERLRAFGLSDSPLTADHFYSPNKGRIIIDPWLAREGIQRETQRLTRYEEQQITTRLFHQGSSGLRLRPFDRTALTSNPERELLEQLLLNEAMKNKIWCQMKTPIDPNMLTAPDADEQDTLKAARQQLNGRESLLAPEVLETLFLGRDVKLTELEKVEHEDHMTFDGQNPDDLCLLIGDPNRDLGFAAPRLVLPVTIATQELIREALSLIQKKGRALDAGPEHIVGLTGEFRHGNDFPSVTRVRRCTKTEGPGRNPNFKQNTYSQATAYGSNGYPADKIHLYRVDVG